MDAELGSGSLFLPLVTNAKSEHYCIHIKPINESNINTKEKSILKIHALEAAKGFGISGPQVKLFGKKILMHINR